MCRQLVILVVLKLLNFPLLSAGSKRIVAVTGPKAIQMYQEYFSLAKILGKKFKVTTERIYGAIQKLKDDFKNAQNNIKTLRARLIDLSIDRWANDRIIVDSLNVLVVILPEGEMDDLRECTQKIEKRLGEGLYFCAAVTQKRAIVSVTLSNNSRNRISLVSLLAWLKENYGIHGGVSAQSIQAGTNNRNLLFLLKN